MTFDFLDPQHREAVFKCNNVRQCFVEWEAEKDRQRKYCKHYYVNHQLWKKNYLNRMTCCIYEIGSSRSTRKERNPIFDPFETCR
jgi:hypothetical protein